MDMKQRASIQNIAKPVILLTLGFLTQSLIAGQIYKWVDENGKVHFGDRPNSNQTQQEVQLKPLNTVGSGNAARKASQQKMLDSYQRRREEKAKNTQAELQRRAKNHKQCLKLQARLEEYQNSSALYTEGPDGERNYMESQQRDRVIEQLKRTIANKCR